MRDSWKEKIYFYSREKNADDTYALTIVYIDNQIQTDTRKTITCIMRLKLMSDVQYLSPKRAVKVRDQSFLYIVSDTKKIVPTSRNNALFRIYINHISRKYARIRTRNAILTEKMNFSVCLNDLCKRSFNERVRTTYFSCRNVTFCV